MASRIFKNRVEAGEVLAKTLSSYSNRDDVLVLALPRGGVPVAAAIANALNLPMDVWIVRKLGVPGYEELAMGALSMGGVCHIDSNIVSRLNIPNNLVQDNIARERLELERRNELYRQNSPLPDLTGKTVILVDDGMATGATMYAAALSLRALNVHRLIVAVPVGAASSCCTLETIADEVICAHMPEPFYGVGQWYEDFTQTTDNEVLALLHDRERALECR